MGWFFIRSGGPDGPEIRLPLFPQKRTQVGHRAMFGSCQKRKRRGGYAALFRLPTRPSLNATGFGLRATLGRELDMRARSPRTTAQRFAHSHTGYEFERRAVANPQHATPQST